MTDAISPVAMLGPPPKLARLVRVIYATIAVVLVVSMIIVMLETSVETRRREQEGGPFGGIGWRALGLLGAYALGLSLGVARLASPGPLRAGSAACAPLILHGLAGLFGSLALLTSLFGGRSSWWEPVLDVGARVATFGVLLGWILVFPAAQQFKRSEVLWVSALSGTALLVLWGALLALGSS